LASPEEMNWSITTCAPLTKSPNCASQITRQVRAGGGIAVFEADHRFLGQYRVDHGEARLAILHVLQRNETTAGVLIVQHRVAVEERTATAVLAGDTHRNALIEQRGVGQGFGRAPVQRHFAGDHLGAVG
jgi:hypothetical protein